MENDELIRRAEDLCRRCEKTASVTHTAFLTPAEQFALEKWARSAPDCNMLLTGGAEENERRAAFFLPFYMDAESFKADEYISALRAKAHFASPTHRDYMGAILGLGIKREWLGDIWIDGEEAVIFIMQSVERHVADGLEKVGRYGVKLQKAELNELAPPERKVKRVSFSVKSMRFDAVLAGMFGLSRTAAVSHIAAGEASLNYSECLKNDAVVSPGDVISLRGHGKGAVSASGGVSRKGRLFVEAEIYK
jgi:RNA-binding protein YlmH